MAERGLGGALSGWAALLARSEFWLVALGLMALNGGLGFLQGRAIANIASGGSSALMGLTTLGIAIVGFFVGAIVQFVLSRQLGGDEASRQPAAIGVWIALTLLYAMAFGLVGFFGPFFLVSSGAAPEAYMLAIPLIMLAVAVAMLPVAVRLVAAVHSGNRYRMRDVTGFLASDPAAWFGGRALLGVAVLAAFRGLAALSAAATGDNTVFMMVSGVLDGLVEALLLLWPIAAYRAMSRREQVAETFI